MYIELICRFVKTPNSEDLEFIEEELREKRLTNPDVDEDYEREKLMEELKSYDYAPMVVNLNEVWAFNEVDGKHFSIRFLNGTLFTFKGKYEHFKTQFEYVSQRKIYNYNQIIIEDEQ